MMCYWRGFHNRAENASARFPIIIVDRPYFSVMDFDFRQEYSRYSNVELLRVLLLRHQYQPAAVAVAEELLAARGVTDEERRLAEESIARKPRTKAKPVAVPWQVGDEIFEPTAAQPAFESVKQRWRILMVVLGLAALIRTWMTLKALSRSSVIGYELLDTLLNVGLLILQIGSFVLAYQRKRRGWIWMLSWTVYLFITSLISLVTLLFYHFYQASDQLLVLDALLVTGGLLLCSQRIKSYYGVDKATLQRTLLLSGGCTALYCMGVIALVNVLSH